MGMRAWERWAPLAGILFVVAFVVAYFVAGDYPKADEGAGAIRDFYADDGAQLTATYLFGIALVFYLSYIGTLAFRLREAGEPRLSAVFFGAGIMAAAIQLVGTIIHGALAYRTPADDGLVQALYDVEFLAYTMVAFPAAVLLGASAMAAGRAGLFPNWFNALTGLAAIATLVGGATLAADGFFAPGGGYALIMTFVFMAWAVVSSAMLTMQAMAEESPNAAAAPM